MSNIGILKDLTIYGAITATSAVYTDALVVSVSSSVPEIVALQNASVNWDAAYNYVTGFSANPGFANLTVDGDITTSGSFVSGNIDLSDVFEPKGYSKQFVSDIVGDGIATTFTFEHTLSTQNVIVNVIEQSTGDIVYPAVSATSAQFVVEFTTPFVGPLYRIVAMGSISIGGSVCVSGGYTPPVTAISAIAPPVSSVAGRTGDIILSASDIIVPVVAETASFTINASDVGSVVKVNSISNVTATVPANDTLPLPVGVQILFVQMGSGQITFSAAAGVTIRSSGSKYKTANQYSLASLVKVDTNEWVLGGELTT